MSNRDDRDFILGIRAGKQNHSFATVLDEPRTYLDGTPKGCVESKAPEPNISDDTCDHDPEADIAAAAVMAAFGFTQQRNKSDTAYMTAEQQERYCMPASAYDWSKSLDPSEERRAKMKALGINPEFLDRPFSTPEQAHQKVQDFLKNLPEHVERFNAMLDGPGRSAACKELKINPQDIPEESRVIKALKQETELQALLSKVKYVEDDKADLFANGVVGVPQDAQGKTVVPVWPIRISLDGRDVSDRVVAGSVALTEPYYGSGVPNLQFNMLVDPTEPGALKLDMKCFVEAREPAPLGTLTSTWFVGAVEFFGCLDPNDRDHETRLMQVKCQGMGVKEDDKMLTIKNNTDQPVHFGNTVIPPGIPKLPAPFDMIVRSGWLDCVAAPCRRCTEKYFAEHPGENLTPETPVWPRFFTGHDGITDIFGCLDLNHSDERLVFNQDTCDYYEMFRTWNRSQWSPELLLGRWENSAHHSDRNNTSLIETDGSKYAAHVRRYYASLPSASRCILGTYGLWTTPETMEQHAHEQLAGLRFRTATAEAPARSRESLDALGSAGTDTESVSDYYQAVNQLDKVAAPLGLPSLGDHHKVKNFPLVVNTEQHRLVLHGDQSDDVLTLHLLYRGPDDTEAVLQPIVTIKRWGEAKVMPGWHKRMGDLAQRFWAAVAQVHHDLPAPVSPKQKAILEFLNERHMTLAEFDQQWYARPAVHMDVLHEDERVYPGTAQDPTAWAIVRIKK
jgi:hypothetical protein